MFDEIVVLLSVNPSFSISYSIALVKYSLDSDSEEYYLIYIKPSIDLINICEEEIFNKAKKIRLSDDAVSEILDIIKESRVSLIADSFEGLDGCNYSLYFFDDNGSAKSHFSWWGNTPNEWGDLNKIVNVLKKNLN